MNNYLNKFGEQVVFTPYYVVHKNPYYVDENPIRNINCVSGGIYCYYPKETTITQEGLMPSAIVMSDFRSWDVNLTMLCEYRDRYRWGLGYRIMGSVNILLGMDIISGLQIGYTCELPTNRLLLESYGSHELYLAYGFDILRPRRNNKYKSVRYL